MPLIPTPKYSDFKLEEVTLNMSGSSSLQLRTLGFRLEPYQTIGFLDQKRDWLNSLVLSVRKIGTGHL